MDIYETEREITRFKDRLGIKTNYPNIEQEIEWVINLTIDIDDLDDEIIW